MAPQFDLPVTQLITSSVLVTTSKAPVTTSVAPVTTSKAPVTTNIDAVAGECSPRLVLQELSLPRECESTCYKAGDAAEKYKCD